MMKYLTLASAALLVNYAAAYGGKATFYGAGGAGGSGACMLQRGFNGVGLTVALNGPQWDGGANCGKCVKITGSSYGIGTTPVVGPIYATIDNQCPECAFGDIDLGLNGDGRWMINWDFVDCGEAAGGWSNIPGPGTPQNNPVRRLRGAEEGEEVVATAPLKIGPGMYLMPDGIKALEEVQAMYAANSTTVVEGGQH